MHYIIASPVFIINVIFNCRAIHPQISSKRQMSMQYLVKPNHSLSKSTQGNLINSATMEFDQCKSRSQNKSFFLLIKSCFFYLILSWKILLYIEFSCLIGYNIGATLDCHMQGRNQNVGFGGWGHCEKGDFMEGHCKNQH